MPSTGHVGSYLRCRPLIYALAVQAGVSPFLSMIAAVAVGMLLDLGVGTIVVYAGLSSLMATLGLNFLLRGLILTEGESISLLQLRDSWTYATFSGSVGGFPVQVFWALLFVAFSIFLFNRHRFGARVRCEGGNPESALQMGINTKRVRVMTFVFMGLGAALAGVFSTMINFTWWPATATCCPP